MNKQSLVKFNEENTFESFTPLDDRKTLGECGFTATNAKVYIIYFFYHQDPRLSHPPLSVSTWRENPDQL